MSSHEELPAFSWPGDPREEALWQAYQAMLRRRNDPRARWSAADAPPVRANAVRPIAPRPAGALATEPGPLVLQPIESLDTDTGRPPPAGARAPSPGRRVALGAAVVLAAGAALALALLPRVATIEGAAPDPIPGTTVGIGPNAAPTQRRALPCFVDGRPVGQFTLDDCANRNGVASGSLQVEVGPGPVRPAPPAAAAIVAQPPRPAPSPVPAQVRPPLAVEPPVRAPFPAVARESWFGSPSAPRPPARFAAPPPQDHGPAPQLAIAEPRMTQAPEGNDRARGPQVPPRRASALAVGEFYSALGDGDGARAASVVVPEKRRAGPLSARALTRFYGSLRAPLRITKIDPINDDTVFVRYEFVTPDNRLCVGSATVATTHRDGDTLVRGIRAFDGC